MLLPHRTRMMRMTPGECSKIKGSYWDAHGYPNMFCAFPIEIHPLDSFNLEFDIGQIFALSEGFRNIMKHPKLVSTARHSTS